MDWKGKLSQAKAVSDKARLLVEAEAREAKEVAAKATRAGAKRVRTTIEGHWPNVQRLFSDTLQRPATAALYDDKLMRRILPLVYEKLPVVVRFAVQENEFVQFCLDNRHRLLLPEVVPPPAAPEDV